MSATGGLRNDSSTATSEATANTVRNDATMQRVSQHNERYSGRLPLSLKTEIRNGDLTRDIAEILNTAKPCSVFEYFLDEQTKVLPIDKEVRTTTLRRVQTFSRWKPQRSSVGLYSRPADKAFLSYMNQNIIPILTELNGFKGGGYRHSG
jgi:hypothetical protein